MKSRRILVVNSEMIPLNVSNFLFYFWQQPPNVGIGSLGLSNKNTFVTKSLKFAEILLVMSELHDVSPICLMHVKRDISLFHFFRLLGQISSSRVVETFKFSLVLCACEFFKVSTRWRYIWYSVQKIKYPLCPVFDIGNNNCEKA